MKLAPKSRRPGLSSLNMDLLDSDGAPPQGQQIQTLRGWPELHLRAPRKAPSAREQLLQAGQGLHRAAAAGRPLPPTHVSTWFAIGRQRKETWGPRGAGGASDRLPASPLG